MTDPIYESLNKIRSLESTTILNEDATTAAAKTAGVGSKLLGKVLPGAGIAMGAYDAAKRLKAGDKVGAGIAGATAGLSSVPVIGTAAALLGTGAQAAWDKYKTGSWFPDDDEVAAGAAQGQQAAAPQAVAPTASQQVPSGGDPKVFALQQKLIAAGAKIKADGVMGKNTQTAMQQFPNIKMAEDNEENKMSESQKIAELMSRLAQLEQAPTQQVADEGIVDMAKGAWQGAKTIGKNLAGGWGGDAARTAKGTYAAGNSAAGVANKVGKAAANNKGKLGLATGAGLTAAGMTAMSGGATKPAEPAKPAKPAKPATGAATKPAASAGAGLNPQEEQELALLANDMMKLKGQNSELDALIDRHLKLRPEIAGGAVPNPEE